MSELMVAVLAAVGCAVFLIALEIGWLWHIARLRSRDAPIRRHVTRSSVIIGVGTALMSGLLHMHGTAHAVVIGVLIGGGVTSAVGAVTFALLIRRPGPEPALPTLSESDVQEIERPSSGDVTIRRL